MSLCKRPPITFCRAISNQQNVIAARHSSHEVQPRKWARWQDVPDDWVLKNNRMPDNPLYKTEKYRNLKKKLIFYQQDDGIPVWLKRGYPYNYLYWFAGALYLITLYGAIKKSLDSGFIFPKKKSA